MLSSSLSLGLAAWSSSANERHGAAWRAGDGWRKRRDGLARRCAHYLARQDAGGRTLKARQRVCMVARCRSWCGSVARGARGWHPQRKSAGWRPCERRLGCELGAGSAGSRGRYCRARSEVHGELAPVGAMGATGLALVGAAGRGARRRVVVARSRAVRARGSRALFPARICSMLDAG